MKFSATDLAAFMDTFAEDTVLINGAEVTGVLHKIFVQSLVGGESIESRAWTLVLKTTDLEALVVPVEHGSSVDARSRCFVVDGVQEDDPSEGFSRLILSEA